MTIESDPTPGLDLEVVPVDPPPLAPVMGDWERWRGRIGLDTNLNRTGNVRIVDEQSEGSRRIDEAPAVLAPEWAPSAVAPINPVELATELSEWWTKRTADEVARTVPKAVEYSSTDLRDIGLDLARMAGRQISDEEATELGIFFYLRGKFARWVGAAMVGQRPSDDTLFDLAIYIKMAQRNRDVGSWP